MTTLSEMTVMGGYLTACLYVCALPDGLDCYTISSHMPCVTVGLEQEVVVGLIGSFICCSCRYAVQGIVPECVP